MHAELVAALRARRPQTRSLWEAVLRTERANTPLANPDALVHLFDWTLDEIFHALQAPPMRRKLARAPTCPDYRADCPCGRNPLLAYFAAGEQAMQEALVLAQVATPGLDAHERDTSLVELNLVLAHIAQREIRSFCSVCQFRETSLPTVAHLAHPHAHEHARRSA